MISKQIMRKIRPVALLASVAVFTIISGILLFPVADIAKAESSSSVESDLNLTVTDVISLGLTNCDNTNNSIVSVDITPTREGVFKSACQTASIHTNAPGYTLTARASNSALQYLNPTTIDPLPVINSTTSQTTNPTILSNNTWGFAVQDRLNFDSTYTIDNPDNKYAALSTDDITIYQTGVFNDPIKSHTFYYGTKLNTDVMAGTYGATITYTAVGESVTEIPGPIQNFADVCYYNDASDNNIGTTTVLRDSRNRQDYRVRCMEDAHWWMIDNLKLELQNGMTLTSEDTNVASDTTVYFTQDGTETGTALTGMTGNFTTSGYMTKDGTQPNTSLNYDAWRQADPTSIDNCINNTGVDIEHVYAADSLTKCGYLYNYYTAVAGSLSQSVGAGYATESICPAGWHLPYNTSINDYGVLNNSMYNGYPSPSANRLEASDNWLPTGFFQGTFAGDYRDEFRYVGDNGTYWAARSSTNITAYQTSILDGWIDTGYEGQPGKWFGASVRCTI